MRPNSSLLTHSKLAATSHASQQQQQPPPGPPLQAAASCGCNPHEANVRKRLLKTVSKATFLGVRVRRPWPLPSFHSNRLQVQAKPPPAPPSCNLLPTPHPHPLIQSSLLQHCYEYRSACVMCVAVKSKPAAACTHAAAERHHDIEQQRGQAAAASP